MSELPNRPETPVSETDTDELPEPPRIKSGQQTSGAFPDELRAKVFGQIIGNFLTLTVCLVIWGNYRLFEDYLSVLIWACLLGVALRPVKQGCTEQLSLLRQRKFKDGYLIGQIWHAAKWNTGDLVKKKSFVPIAVIVVMSLVLSVHLFPWGVVVTVLTAQLLSAVVLLALIKHDYISKELDDSIVSGVLLFSLTAMLFFVTVFFAYECIQEGQEAVSLLLGWLDEKILQNQEIRQQLIEAKMLAQKTGAALEEQLNHTPIGKRYGPIINAIRLHAAQTNGTMALNWATLQSTFTTIMSGGNSTTSVLPSNTTLATVRNATTDLHHTFSEVLPHIQNTLTRLVGGSSKVFSLATNILLLFVLSLADLGFRILMFFGVMFHVLTAKENVVQKNFNRLMGAIVSTEAHWSKVQTSIEQVFVRPLRMSVVLSAVTFAVFWICGIDFCFFATFLRFAVTLVPICASKWIVLPWLLAGCIRLFVIGGDLQNMIQVIALTGLIVVDPEASFTFDVEESHSRPQRSSNKRKKKRSSGKRRAASKQRGKAGDGSDQTSTLASLWVMTKGAVERSRTLSVTSDPGSASHLDDSQSQESHPLYPYLLGLSAYTALPVFGFQGILLGPLLLFLVVMAWDLILEDLIPKTSKGSKGGADSDVPSTPRIPQPLTHHERHLSRLHQHAHHHSKSWSSGGTVRVKKKKF